LGCDRLREGLCQARGDMKKLSLICRTALPLLLCGPYAAYSQDNVPAPAADEERQVTFSADQVEYDSEREIVTASGQVRMVTEGNVLNADRVIWNRETGEVRAEGNVRVVSPGGDTAYGDSVVLADTLRDGAVSNLLLVLEDGGRLAAERASREGGVTRLERAAYSPCAVLDPDTGCPKNPSWTINAVEVVHDPVRNRIYYRGAQLNLFGLTIAALPGFSHPDGSEGGSGLLVPELRISRSNGVELSVPYHWRIAPNRDATFTPHVYSGALPALEARYRHLTDYGPFQIGGLVTYGSLIRINPATLETEEIGKRVRAYLEGNGKFQLDPLWSITSSARVVTDKTFLRRYDISLDSRLRSLVNAERISHDSYISIAGWAFQTLRATEAQGEQPIALPAIDARWRLEDPFWDGRIELQANSLSLLRPQGQDTQRAFAGARWDRRSITAWGQELVLTAYGRADAYHTNGTELTPTLIYRGEEGFNFRGIAALAADIKWPLAGPLFGGTQRLTPRLQFVASPRTKNLDIPNEDARSVDLEDSNLFALNRFPGYDRWEDGPRVTYGADWALDLPGIAIRSTVGQSYRLNQRQSILPPGTGLSDRFSDLVGRTNVQWGRRLNLVHRFRVDKNNLDIRRNEIDATYGGRRTYATIGYLRLDRDISLDVEDLRDREELRLGGRAQVARHWSVFGSTVIDLTSQHEDPSSTSDGWTPVRHRLGLTYSDDCIELGVTWRRDYDATGDVRRGNTFLFRVALRNLGR
jgi:LPS-assembly protein